MVLKSVFFLLFISSFPAYLYSWAEHPLLVRPVLEKLELWEGKDSVNVVSLVAFLESNAKELDAFLEEHEDWARENLINYRNRPGDLRLNPNLRGDDLRRSFLMAVRMNPNSKIPLYLHLMPGKQAPVGREMDPLKISVFDNLKKERNTSYLKLTEGDSVHPLDVLVTANDEPDYGFDIGLFENNGTEYGEVYGFGNQPFGNPNLPYSSQAAFHMSFYHESGLVYRLRPDLNNSLLESRLFLFRDLALFAFSVGEDYWGWRFLGWSMHYAGDLTMPYHSTALPGFSTLEMLRSQLNAIRGDKRDRRNMIQLVSNRHTVLEAYQIIELKRVHLEKDKQHPYFSALREAPEIPAFSPAFARTTASANSSERAGQMDRAIQNTFPHYLVNDPNTEVRFLPELRIIDEIIADYASAEQLENLNREIAERFTDFSATVLSLFYSVIELKD